MTALMAAACSSAPTTGGVTSPSEVTPTSTPVASPTPSISLALVTLRGSSSYVVRDLTDINHPKTVSNLGIDSRSILGPVFVSGTEISFADASDLYRVPLAGAPKTLVTSQGNPGVWSPDGSAVLYTTYPNAETATVHQLKAGRDQILGSVPGGGGGDCQSILNCAFIENSLDSRLLYSPDGTKISLVTLGFSGSVFRIWSSDGQLLKSSDTYGATMSAWSGSSLYFRDTNGVEVWRDGAINLFLSHTTWIAPSASPSGSQIVYAARDSHGWAHTFVVDTATLKLRELKSARAHPVFLTSRFIWYEGERACVAAEACGAKPPYHPLSGKTYIYDLQTGTETESIITNVYDIWPHAA